MRNGNVLDVIIKDVKVIRHAEIGNEYYLLKVELIRYQVEQEIGSNKIIKENNKSSSLKEEKYRKYDKDKYILNQNILKNRKIEVFNITL